MTSIRETFEETGLLFGSPGKAIERVTHRSWTIFREKKICPDLRHIDYLGRAITPSDQPLRFHARFFATSYQNLHGNMVTDGELEDLGWLKLSASHEKKMMVVQQVMLGKLANYLSGAREPPARLIFNGPRQNSIKIT
jgi:8-oxo-dGTP pyrophosphatase MutT (NUDIX family)